MTAEPRISRFEATLLVALFAAIVCLPFFKQVFFGEAKTEMIEGRRLNTFPELSRKHLGAIKEFPVAFERYYNDHFGFRSALLNMGSHFGVKFANVSLSPDVIIGKSGWLFMKNEPNQEAYTAGSTLSGEDLGHWMHFLERRQAWLARRGIKFLFVVPPDKQDIYPEFMPDKYSHIRVKPLVDQLADYLAAHHSTVNVLSLREPMLAARAVEKERLYYRHDTHWNALGAFVGYRSIIDDLRRWFPEMKPLDRSDFRVEMEFSKGDLARTMGVPDYSAGDEATLKFRTPPRATMVASETKLGLDLPDGVRVTTETHGTDNRRRAVVQHDSFMVLLTPMLSENFVRSVYLARGSADLKSELYLAGVILKEKPDVFIEERLERFLLMRPPEENMIFGGGE